MIAATANRGSMRLASALLWATLAYNVLEGIIAVSAGIRAQSVALVGFGLDSGIEVTASVILLWRMQSSGELSERRELIARRVVGATFLVLAAYIVIQVAYTLLVGDQPESSTLGLWLAIASLTLMPALGLLKRWNAQRLHSHALMAEASETLVCSYLSAALFAGLALNAAFGWWWADIAAALAMTPWIVKEGIEGLRGDPCGDDCP
jgi:divalent metal cation (Fe/Co/Zn/Cd) transporter